MIKELYIYKVRGLLYLPIEEVDYLSGISTSKANQRLLYTTMHVPLLLFTNNSFSCIIEIFVSSKRIRYMYVKIYLKKF